MGGRRIGRERKERYKARAGDQGGSTESGTGMSDVVADRW